MNAEFRQLLEAGDVDRLWRMWGRIAPHLPQPKSRDEAEVVMHMARTASESVRNSVRYYSHAWLRERAIPSQLPEALKPEAERQFPTIAEAVGISVNFRSQHMRPAALEVRGSMEGAVEDCFANGDRDPVVVKKQMEDARARTMRALFGR